jgi:hypothetical protein
MPNPLATFPLSPYPSALSLRTLFIHDSILLDVPTHVPFLCIPYTPLYP